MSRLGEIHAANTDAAPEVVELDVAHSAMEHSDVVSRPARPAVYHITHVENLPQIIADDGLFSARVISARGGPAVNIGMTKVKADRLAKVLECHAPDKVGDFVPFNFCPRSVMLYVIHKASHPSLPFKGGQDRVLHLVADFERVVTWADAHGVRWAVTDVNARAEYAQSSASVNGLDLVDWAAVANHDFRDDAVQQSKQAEFLLHEKLPWDLVDHIGVRSLEVAAEVMAALAASAHKPAVTVERSWYF